MGKKAEDRRKYINSQAQQVLARLAVPLGVCGHFQKDEFARFLWTQYHASIRSQYLACCRDDHLGNIAACGRSIEDRDCTRLCDLNAGEVFPWDYNGRAVLEILAAAAIIAELTDILWAELQKEKTEKAKPKSQFERMFAEGKRFIAHCRSDVGGHWYYQSIQDQDLRLTIRCQFALPASEVKKQIELLKGMMTSWVPTEKELTTVLEVVEDMGSSKKEGAVLFTHTCGPALSVQERVDRCADNLTRDLGYRGP